jgi:hypothetical protein
MSLQTQLQNKEKSCYKEDGREGSREMRSVWLWETYTESASRWKEWATGLKASGKSGKIKK